MNPPPGCDDAPKALPKLGKEEEEWNPEEECPPPPPKKEENMSGWLEGEGKPEEGGGPVEGKFGNMVNLFIVANGGSKSRLVVTVSQGRTSK